MWGGVLFVVPVEVLLPFSEKKIIYTHCIGEYNNQYGGEYMKFKATIRQYATSHVVTIPSDDIKNERVKPGKTYWFEIQEEVQDAE